jgi:hypothetical protein
MFCVCVVICVCPCVYSISLCVVNERRENRERVEIEGAFGTLSPETNSSSHTPVQHSSSFDLAFLSN